jgi:hypothetical protein
MITFINEFMRKVYYTTKRCKVRNYLAKHMRI